MLRIATIGTSPITENFIEVLRANDRAVFAGAQSRDAERAHVFTQEHGGKHGYSSVEELAADSAIDAVYIGSPNACHAPQALALISAGKHVLVEKSKRSSTPPSVRTLLRSRRCVPCMIRPIISLRTRFRRSVVSGALPFALASTPRATTTSLRIATPTSLTAIWHLAALWIWVSTA